VRVRPFPPGPPEGLGFGVENNYFTEMCSGSEAGSYSRLIDFVYHSMLGLRVIKKKSIPEDRGTRARLPAEHREAHARHPCGLGFRVQGLGF